MPTQAKIDEVAHLKEKLESAVSLVLADYRGLTANEMVELREKFTKQGLEYRVVKDTLARIAANEAGMSELAELIAGPISVTFGYEDPAAAFKLNEECRKKYAPRYELRGGLFEGALVIEAEVRRYATLPSREELLAKLAMLLSSPMRALAFMLQAKIRELAVVLAEVAKSREQEPEQQTEPEVPEEQDPAEEQDSPEQADPEEQQDEPDSPEQPEQSEEQEPQEEREEEA
jgi:large subunit ribosomal protein L10